MWRMCSACWISKATRARANAHAHAFGHARARARARTHTNTQKCVIFTAFPRQQWFCERVSVLTLNLHCLSCLSLHWQSEPYARLTTFRPFVSISRRRLWNLHDTVNCTETSNILHVAACQDVCWQ